MSAVDLKCTEELIPVRAFGITVKTEKPVKSVVKLPGQTPIKFEYSDGRVMFTASELTMFAMYRIINEQGR